MTFKLFIAQLALLFFRQNDRVYKKYYKVKYKTLLFIVRSEVSQIKIIYLNVQFYLKDKKVP
jgi:hypothetical protein